MDDLQIGFSAANAGPDRARRPRDRPAPPAGGLAEELGFDSVWAGDSPGWLAYPPAWQTYADDMVSIRPGVTPALYATVCVDDDSVRARRRQRTSVERYYNAPLEFVGSIQAMFAGTAAETAVWLGRYVTAGARHIVVRLAVDDHEKALAEFADHVLPLLRGGEFA